MKHFDACDVSCGGTVAEETSVSDSEALPVVFNRGEALTRLGGMEELLLDVLQLMHRESPKVRARISSAFATREATELKRAVHTLKGSVSIVGAADLAKRLMRVEQLAGVGDFESVAIEIPEIDRQLDKLQNRLTTELSKV